MTEKNPTYDDRIQVYCPHCSEWVDEDDATVEFLGLTTFRHTTCGVISRSQRRDRPPERDRPSDFVEGSDQ